MCTITPEPCASMEGRQRAVEAHGRQEVDGESVAPVIVRQRREASAGRRRPAGVVHQYVDSSQTLQGTLGHVRRPLGRAEVGGEEEVGMVEPATGPRGRS